MNEPANREPVKPGAIRALLGLGIFELRSRTTLAKLAQSAALILGIPAMMLLVLPTGDAKPFLNWIVNFHLLLVVPLTCLTTFGPLIRDELQSDTLGFIVTRPIRRHTLYLLKYLCTMVWTQCMMILAGLAFLGVAFLKDLSISGSAVPLFFLSQSIAVLAFGAVGGLLGLLSKKYMIIGVLYGFVVEVGFAGIPTNIHTLAISHHLTAILGNSAALAGHFNWTAGSIPESIGITAAISAVYLTLAGLLFTTREYHHSDEMEK